MFLMSGNEQVDEAAYAVLDAVTAGNLTEARERVPYLKAAFADLACPAEVKAQIMLNMVDLETSLQLMADTEKMTRCREERCEDGSILVRDADDTLIAHLTSDRKTGRIFPGQGAAYRRYLREIAQTQEMLQSETSRTV
jgi:hypothetical protein